MQGLLTSRGNFIDNPHMISNKLLGICVDVVKVSTFSLFKLGIILRALMLELRIKLENIGHRRNINT